MKKYRIISWNINGIRAVHRKNALDWFLDEQPDILCLQETKAQEEQVPERLRFINGYYTYFESAERKGYSGVGLYSKEKPKKIKTKFGVEAFDREGRIISADFGKFILFNVYFPNGKASKERLKYKLDFYETFLEHVNLLKEKGKKIIICGDVNTAHKEIDLARPKENEKVSGFLPIERAWIDKLLDNEYIDTLRQFDDRPGLYTWWDYKTGARDRNVGWRIDYFFVSANLKTNLQSAFILPNISGSDHCPLGVEIKIYFSLILPFAKSNLCL
ncbi:MAG: exodeoxyribonuclease III [Candidatus Zixiibacteriota bacterium]